MKMENTYSKNVELIGYHDLNDRPGFQMAMQEIDGKYYLYVSAHCNAGKIHLVLQCCSIHKNQGGLLQKIQSYQR